MECALVSMVMPLRCYANAKNNNNSNRLGWGCVIAVWAESAWGKQSFSPHWKSMVLTQNSLHKIISAARQSKIHWKNEPYWVGRPNGMARGVVFPTLFVTWLSLQAKESLLQAYTWQPVKVNICRFILLNFNKVMKARVKASHTLLMLY